MEISRPVRYEEVITRARQPCSLDVTRMDRGWFYPVVVTGMKLFTGADAVPLQDATPTRLHAK